MFENNIIQIIDAYDSKIIKIYSYIRFYIIRQRFLDEIGQYLPARGRILDVGCGFGLFSLYFAQQRPEAVFFGIDRNANRIAIASAVAAKLNIANVHYSVADARSEEFSGPLDAAYMLDIVHHVPPARVQPMIKQLHTQLACGGYLIVKDIADRPAYKRWFTYILDKLMDYKTPVHYWAIDHLTELLRAEGFEVHTHLLVDYLPYPHVMYICRKI